MASLVRKLSAMTSALIMEVEIDEECQNIIALRQPAAGDLRMVIAIIKTITDLERIGDEAEKIGRMAIRLAGSGGSKRHMSGVQHMGTQVLKMVQDSLDAFARLDVESALQLSVPTNRWITNTTRSCAR